MNSAVLPRAGGGDALASRAAGTGLWVFIVVASTLFALFLLAYAMRMDSSDWSPIARPWQLWLSSALLLAGSVLLQRASAAAQRSNWGLARALLWAGGACALAFLGSQWWAWQALQAARVQLAGNPAASFFYLLTALHALHVLGGLAAWAVTAQLAWERADPARVALRIALCARYWHFLLVVWAVLFAALGWLTPEIVRFLCGRG
jgi:cytochrome c oxidase subunit 3